MDVLLAVESGGSDKRTGYEKLEIIIEQKREEGGMVKQIVRENRKKEKEAER